MKRLFLCLVLISAAFTGTAQSLVSIDTGKVVIPMNRMLWHDNLDKEQKRTDKLDGKVDG